VLLDTSGDLLLALTRENIPVIARFHLARLSFGDAVHTDHSLEALADLETVDEKQSNCQRGD
jgi:hypothetical protein